MVGGYDRKGLREEAGSCGQTPFAVRLADRDLRALKSG